MGLIPLLTVLALLGTIGSTTGKVPLWVPVLLLCLIVLLQVWR